MSSPVNDQGLVGLPELELGATAPRDVRSPRDVSVRDRIMERRLRQEAMDAVMPVYDLLSGRAANIKGRLDHAFGDARQAFAHRSPSATKPDVAEDFMRTLGTHLNEVHFDALVRLGFDEVHEDAIEMILTKVLEHRITKHKKLLSLHVRKGVRLRYLDGQGQVSQEVTLTDYRDVISLEEARAQVDSVVSEHLKHLTGESSKMVSAVAKRLIRPNLVSNEIETERRIILAGQSIQPSLIKVDVGDLLLRRGEQVTQRDKLILSALRDSYQTQNQLMTPFGSALTILFLVIGLFAFYRSDADKFLPRSRDLAFVTGVYVVSLLLLWSNYRFATAYADHDIGLSPSAIHFLVPVAFGTILTRLVLGFKASAALLPLLAITAGWVMDMSLGYTIYALMGGIAGATMKTGRRPKRQILIAGFWCGLWQAVTVLFLALHEHALGSERLVDLVAALGSGLFASLLTLVSIPLIEALFGYTTSIRLGELANLNHPLLRDLLVQAPATYHHSIMVGAMAEASARRVSANPLLAKVAGYYHDVGKLEQPSLYKENRVGELETQRLSETEAKNIRNHVADSLSLGAKHRLGHAVLEIIAQHHGDSVVGEHSQRLSDEGSLRPIKIDDFRYPGPKPISKEAGLVLLADAVESAISRIARHEEMADEVMKRTVHQVIGETVASGQLDECALSLSDVYAIGSEFIPVLQMSVQRMSQPPSSNLRLLESHANREASGDN